MTNTLNPQQEKTLNKIIKLLKDADLKVEDVQRALSVTEVVKPQEKQTGLLPVVVGYIAGAFMLCGLFIFVSVIWNDLNSFARVVITLGTGLLSYITGHILRKDDVAHSASPFLWLLSGFLIPMGLFVFLKEFIGGNDAILGGTVVFGTTTLLYLISFIHNNAKSFLFLTFLYGIAFIGTFYEHIGTNTPLVWLVTGLGLLFIGCKTRLSSFASLSPLPFIVAGLSLASTTYYFFANTPLESAISGIYIALIALGYIIGSRMLIIICFLSFIALYCKEYFYSWSHPDSEFYTFVSVIMGASMVMTAAWFKKIKALRQSAFWYFFGSTLVFTAFASLLYKTPYDIGFVVVPGIMIYIALRAQSRALLFSSVLSFISFIFYYSGEYFADTVGWPLLLMVIGLLLGGISMVSLKVSAKMKLKET